MENIAILEQHFEKLNADLNEENALEYIGLCQILKKDCHKAFPAIQNKYPSRDFKEACIRLYCGVISDTNRFLSTSSCSDEDIARFCLTYIGMCWLIDSGMIEITTPERVMLNSMYMMVLDDILIHATYGGELTEAVKKHLPY